MKKKYLLVFHCNFTTQDCNCRRTQKQSFEEVVECDPDKLLEKIQSIKKKLGDATSKTQQEVVSDVQLQQILKLYD